MVGYITNSMEMNLSKLWKIVEEEEPGVLYSPWDHKELDIT